MPDTHRIVAPENKPDATGSPIAENGGNTPHDALLIARGYEPIAVNGKAPVAPGWPLRPNTVEALEAEREHSHATNTGLRTGSVSGIDIDLRNPEHVAAVKTLAMRVLGYTSMERIGAKGVMLLYRNASPIDKITITYERDDGKRPVAIEILGTGQQLVAYGIHPDTGKPYHWPNADMGDEPLCRALADLPEVTPDKLREFARQAAGVLTELGYRKPKASGPGVTEREPLPAPEGFKEDTPRAIHAGYEEVQRWIALGKLPTDGNRNHTVASLAARLRAIGCSEAMSVRLIEDTYLKAPGAEAPDEAIDYIVASAYRSKPLNPPGSELPKTGAETFGRSAEQWLRELEGTPEAWAQYAEENPVTPDDSDALVSAKGRRPMKTEWLWNGWLARGKLHILAGAKGVGKSTLVYDLLATLTRGGKWPDGAQSEPGNVVVWSSEDDFDDTILPRFLAAGGDPARLFPVEKVRGADGVERHFDPAYDMPFLLREVRKLGNVAAILIDPIVSAVTGDSHKNAETRRGLQPLVDTAAACGAALIGITHFSKGTDGKNPVDRVNGSLAFGAIARIVLCAGADEDGQQRRLVRASSNIGPMGDGFGYTLSQEPVPGEDFTASRVLWGSRLQGSARELLGDGAKEDKTTAATDFITARLAGGPVLSKDMREAADALGHSWPTVNRARAKMPWVVIKQMTKGQRGEALPEAPEGSFQRGWYWCDDTLLGGGLHGKVEY